MKTLKEKIEVMQAALEGKPIQWRDLFAYEDSNWCDTKDAEWAWHVNDYRVKPSPPAKKLVAMQSEDYPPVFWVRRKSYPEEHLLCVGFHGSWLKFASNIYGYGDHAATTYAMGGIDVKDPRPCEYSVDRKTWLPCVKQIDA